MSAIRKEAETVLRENFNELIRLYEKDMEPMTFREYVEELIEAEGGDFFRWLFDDSDWTGDLTEEEKELFNEFIESI